MTMSNTKDKPLTISSITKDKHNEDLFHVLFSDGFQVLVKAVDELDALRWGNDVLSTGKQGMRMLRERVQNIPTEAVHTSWFSHIRDTSLLRAWIADGKRFRYSVRWSDRLHDVTDVTVVHFTETLINKIYPGEIRYE